MPAADLVIMGGGLAGLVAGNRALELGLSAVILERGASEDYPCDSRVATGAIHLASTSPKGDPGAIVSRIVEKTSGFANVELARTFAETAGRAIDWLGEHGAEFLQSTPTPRFWLAPTRGRQQGLTWKGWGPDLLLQRLTESFKRLGGTLVLGAEGQQLLLHDGVCTGIRALTPSGEVDYEARAVLLADGGFQASDELIGRFITRAPAKIRKRNTATAIGTGIRMAERAGANLVGMKYFYGHLLSRDALRNDRLWPYPTLDLMASVSVVVSRAGERLADEGLGGIFLANQIAWQEDPLDYWLIYDDALWQSDLAARTTDPANPDSPNPDLVGLGGTVVSADSLAELAIVAGIEAEPLAATVAGFNKAVASQDFTRLTPPRTLGVQAPRPIAQPPFHAAPLCVGLTFTMGGPEVDVHCRVIRPDGSPVPGLYVIGSAIGGLEGGETVGYWGGLSQALISGLLAPEHVAASAKLK